MGYLYRLWAFLFGHNAHTLEEKYDAYVKQQVALVSGADHAADRQEMVIQAATERLGRIRAIGESVQKQMQA